MVHPCLPDIGYLIFGMEVTNNRAKASFVNLVADIFPVLVDEYPKDKLLYYLAVAPALTFLKECKNFWAQVLEEV